MATTTDTRALARSDELMGLFTREGYRRIEPPVLQPVDVFLELSGEDLRRRLFLTQDAAGNELCLRPDYTIPVSRAYLASPDAGSPASLCYHGPVFRQRAGEIGEIPQAGIENFGRSDREAADAEVLALAMEAAAHFGLAAPVVRLGDMGLLAAVLDALKLAPATRRRVLRAITQGKPVDAPTNTANGNDDHAGLLAAIAGQDAKAARAFVEDVLAIAGISKVGGRTAGEIAERFLARAEAKAGELSAEAHATLQRFLAVEGDPDSAAAALRALARETGLAIDAAIDTFEARTGFMAARGIDVTRLSFSASFARNLDYYTGFIFELHDPARPEEKPIVGGGRYDNLLSQLGAAQPIPAVGCSIWIERINGAAS
ncbi:ATP phosphoribosyltransferase regulatory subunit [Chelatococcus composti]|jgi:ATP phosphoribosyltransferase involved in histidine biosynthesis|uniref:ATP phosphoribosyltransferase regulatory subunit n=1 Tax=Chelatococcus composti TaxID=1743235 RepID=A0A841K6X6_9HYPH|nr:ATP phosphoribosyltransferase regulatory subunit [Chelatococcus composti]MBB6168578.1 ATP phosphoribosyltransferase regulatory subunit [Chelatococcus composti]MBS7736343.1 ATP phosphoribosyltransferase regulatory subunit [Chelatococcus composti]PZN40764.1 MAG: ATP phosphoribosyltransferase regulatory subunit [Pseudomonadota bacterium]GGG41141.1 ATP phosphoribosyltransferase regulatory subunit [Chelatococcus composti]